MFQVIFIFLLVLVDCSQGQSSSQSEANPTGWHSVPHHVFYPPREGRVSKKIMLPRGEEIGTSYLLTLLDSLPVEFRIAVLSGRIMKGPLPSLYSLYKSHIASLKFIDTRLLRFLCTVAFRSRRILDLSEASKVRTAADVLRHFRDLYINEFEYLSTDHIMVWFKILIFEELARKPKILIPDDSTPETAKFARITQFFWRQHIAKIRIQDLLTTGYEFH